MTPRTHAARVAVLVLIKLAVSVALLATGYHGVSDDDFARVVIAQELAHAPKLDPSGTSWLPLPFWLTGGVMAALGTDLRVAFAVAVLLGVASVLLVHAAALRLTADPESAFWGAAIAALLPWSVRLGSSPVPELPVAAACLYAVSTLAPCARYGGRVRGAALLFAACLSRYEPWFVAAVFALTCLWDALRGSVTGAGRARSWRDRALLLGGASIALAGPILWSLHNARAHGSATHYLDRVAAYKQAVDGGDLADRVTSYFFAMFRAEPELAVVLAFAAWRVGRGRGRDALRDLAGFARPAAAFGLLLLALTASSIRGGAPTHHPERALVALHLLGAVLCGHLLVSALRADRLGSPRGVVRAALVIAVVTAGLRSGVLYRESLASRAAEIALGREVARRVAPGDKIMIEVADYGYFATMAGSGRPWDFIPSRNVPAGAKVDTWEPREALAERARREGARALVARDTSGAYGIVELGAAATP